MEPSDDDLMQRVADDDDGRAFAVLVQRHEARLRLFLARSLPNDVDAAASARDVAQDVFVDVWKSRKRYQARGFFLAWLLRMARSRAASRGRALRVRRFFAGAAAASTTTTAPCDGLESVLHKEQADRLRAAIATLPTKTREALTLRFTYDLEPREIAEILGVDAGAVRVRLHRGLELLRARVPEDEVLVVVPVLLEEGVR